MNLLPAYLQQRKEWKQEGKQEGRQQGRQQGKEILWSLIVLLVPFLFTPKSIAYSDGEPLMMSRSSEESIDNLPKSSELDSIIAQIQANLGWLYIQSGRIDRGVSLLLETPLAPSYRAAFFFPESHQESERRRLYLETLNVLNKQLNGTTLVLAHIFISHLSDEQIFEPDLFEQLQALANQTRSPIYYNALGDLAYEQGDWAENLKYSEAVINRIEELSLEVRDSKYLSHFYFNSACGYSRLKMYERAAERLRQTFSIDRSLESWSWQDPALSNLREHLGEEQFRKLISQPNQ